MPTQDGRVSFDLVCTVCENKVFGFRGEYGKSRKSCLFILFMNKLENETNEMRNFCCEQFLTELLSTKLPSPLQVARLKLKEIDGRAPPGKYIIAITAAVTLTSKIYLSHISHTISISWPLSINYRSGTCGLIWLNTGKLIRYVDTQLQCLDCYTNLKIRLSPHSLWYSSPPTYRSRHS